VAVVVVLDQVMVETTAVVVLAAKTTHLVQVVQALKVQ
jgi:hypothetical protein